MMLHLLYSSADTRVVVHEWIVYVRRFAYRMKCVLSICIWTTTIQQCIRPGDDTHINVYFHTKSTVSWYSNKRKCVIRYKYILTGCHSHAKYSLLPWCIWLDVLRYMRIFWLWRLFKRPVLNVKKMNISQMPYVQRMMWWISIILHIIMITFLLISVSYV